jgi:hypothetical protein
MAAVAHRTRFLMGTSPCFSCFSKRAGNAAVALRFKEGAGVFRACDRVQERLERNSMARKYSRSAGKDVAKAVRRKKKGTLKSGKGGKGGKVKSRKQAIAIGLSEARKKGKKVPKKAKKSKKKKTKKRKA